MVVVIVLGGGGGGVVGGGCGVVAVVAKLVRNFCKTQDLKKIETIEHGTCVTDFASTYFSFESLRRPANHAICRNLNKR